MLRSSRLGIMGFSLGAAVAMQAMAQESRIQCGIFEGGFASFRETYHDYGERMIHLRIPSFTSHQFMHLCFLFTVKTINISPFSTQRETMPPVVRRRKNSILSKMLNIMIWVTKAALPIEILYSHFSMRYSRVINQKQKTPSEITQRFSVIKAGFEKVWGC